MGSLHNLREIKKRRNSPYTPQGLGRPSNHYGEPALKAQASCDLKMLLTRFRGPNSRCD